VSKHSRPSSNTSNSASASGIPEIVLPSSDHLHANSDGDEKPRGSKHGSFELIREQSKDSQNTETDDILPPGDPIHVQRKSPRDSQHSNGNFPKMPIRMDSESDKSTFRRPSLGVLPPAMRIESDDDFVARLSNTSDNIDGQNS